MKVVDMKVLIKCYCQSDAYNQEKTSYYTDFGFSGEKIPMFDVIDMSELNQCLQDAHDSFIESEYEILEDRAREEGFKIDSDYNDIDVVVTYEILN